MKMFKQVSAWGQCFVQGAVVGLLAIGLAEAQAAVVELSFSAQAANPDVISFDSGPDHWDFVTFSNLTLSSVVIDGNASPTADLAQGDEVIATVQFDQPVTIPVPPTVLYNGLVLGLQGTGGGFDPGVSTATTDATAAIFLNGVDVSAGLISAGGSGSSTVIYDGGLLAYPATTSGLQFDSYRTHFTVQTLDSPVVVTSAYLHDVSRSPIPEPASLALAVAGLACVGWRARRAR